MNSIKTIDDLKKLPDNTTVLVVPDKEEQQKNEEQYINALVEKIKSEIYTQRDISDVLLAEIEQFLSYKVSVQAKNNVTLADFVTGRKQLTKDLSNASKIEASLDSFEKKLLSHIVDVLYKSTRQYTEKYIVIRTNSAIDRTKKVILTNAQALFPTIGKAIQLAYSLKMLLTDRNGYVQFCNQDILTNYEYKQKLTTITAMWLLTLCFVAAMIALIVVIIKRQIARENEEERLTKEEKKEQKRIKALLKDEEEKKNKAKKDKDEKSKKDEKEKYMPEPVPNNKLDVSETLVTAVNPETKVKMFINAHLQ